jgi:hypothetical protein
MNIQWPGRQTQVESGTAGRTSSRNGGGGGGVQSGGCCARLDPVIPAATRAARSKVRTRGAVPFIMCPYLGLASVPPAQSILLVDQRQWPGFQ